jgi:hypothetical protein
LDELAVQLAGLPGKSYELAVWNPDQVKSVDGANLEKLSPAQGRLKVIFPTGATSGYVHTKLTFHLTGR